MHHPVNHRHSPIFSSPKLLDAQFAKLFPHQTFPLYGMDQIYQNTVKNSSLCCSLYTTKYLVDALLALSYLTHMILITTGMHSLYSCYLAL